MIWSGVETYLYVQEEKLLRLIIHQNLFTYIEMLNYLNKSLDLFPWHRYL